MSKPRLLVIVGLGSFGFLLGAWRYNDRQVSSVPFDITSPVAGDLVQAVTASGSLQPKRTVDIKYDGQELIENITVREGDHVHRGEIVARMDTRLLGHQYSQNMQAIEKDKATLVRAEAAYHREQALFQEQIVARAELETYQAIYESILHQVKADEQAALETKQQVDLASLRSPVDGIVTEVYVHAGEMLGSATAVAGLGPSAAVSKPTNVLMTIAEGGELSAYADVNAADLGNVYEGQPADISIDAFRPTIFHGTVKRVALQPVVLNNITTYQVVVDIRDPNPRFRMGIPVDVMLFRTVRAGSLILPSQAVRPTRDGGNVCVLHPTSNGQNEQDGKSWVDGQNVNLQILARTNNAVAVSGPISAKDWIALHEQDCQKETSKHFMVQPRRSKADLKPSFTKGSPTKDLASEAVLPPPQQKSWLERLLGL
jgi:multidrug efflux pump subunit AcrA (membrane-fusion protein)